jgi:hypothetical protein
VSIKDCVSWATLQQALIMYWRTQNLWGPGNLVASTVTELDDTPLCLTDVHWDNTGATHGCLSRYRVEDLHYGTVGPAQPFDSHRELWPLVVPSWLMCLVLSGYFPCKVYIDLNLRDSLRCG